MFQVSMSKFVLQTFHVTDTFLQGVRHKSSIYPEDINLAKVCYTSTPPELLYTTTVRRVRGGTATTGVSPPPPYV